MPVRVQAGGFTKYSRRRGNAEAKAQFLIRLQGTTREISHFLNQKNSTLFLNSRIISFSFTKRQIYTRSSSFHHLKTAKNLHRRHDSNY